MLCIEFKQVHGLHWVTVREFPPVTAAGASYKADPAVSYKADPAVSYKTDTSLSFEADITAVLHKGGGWVAYKFSVASTLRILCLLRHKAMNSTTKVEMMTVTRNVSVTVSPTIKEQSLAPEMDKKMKIKILE